MAKFRYKMLKIDTNALIPQGAMGFKAVYKEDGHYTKPTQIFKNDELMELTTVLVKFGEFDSQDMILDDYDVATDAMIDFLKNGNKSLKIMHSTDDTEENYVEAFLKEAYMTKADGELNGIAKHSLVAVYKFTDEDDYEIAKALSLETSIEGKAELEELQEEITKSRLKEFVEKYAEQFADLFGDNVINKILKKGENEMNEEQIKIMEDLRKSVSDLETKLEEADKKVEDLTKAKEEDKSDEKLEELQKSYDELKKSFEERVTEIDNQEDNEIDVSDIEI
jgi:DNA repair exonuclease SbcCD ATPase subunit